ncbi:hypothetical protein GO755_05740 [Spirosoma sp. HMF4905]|uniref:PorT family protein n=1 Tax=Spirosoma arboris TaxID=2682092 RepID=A0A7K1S6X2_9BACT|nr:hypothetical protein [Spirosoma arboris]MVM29525.1 hypothetical protein [Spirosoma arboris]
MPELTDDQLDGLFRKSVEEFDTPFDPAAWQDMKARLDANDRTTPSGALTWKNLLRWGLPVALLLLLTGGGWFVYHKANSGRIAAPSPKAANSRTELTGITKGIPQAETPRLADTERSNKKPASLPEQTGGEVGQVADRGETVNESGNPDNHTGKSLTRPTEIILPKVSDATERANAEASPTKALIKSKVGSATKSVTSSYRLKKADEKTRADRLSLSSTPKNKASISVRKQRNASHNPVAFSTTGYALSSTPSSAKRSAINSREASPPDISSMAGNIVSPESNEAISVVLPTINELAIRPAHWPKSLAFTGRPVEAQPDTTAQRVAPKLPPMRGLSVRFVVAPDLSTVGLKNFARPGTNVGLLLEYRLASRWSIQAGVIKSTKVYKTLPSEYTAPETWWQPPMKSPDYVDGRCNMFDIPINIRYDVVVKPRLDGRLPSRWFVSGGVTSYIMKKEDYYYTYPAHTYNQPTEWSTNTGGYGFSNLNLSVGYERSISRRLSWQVEPFMKAPLKGVGFFKVNLLSTGAFFSLRYKL